MLKTIGKRYLSLILAVMLVVSLMPLTAQAASISGLTVENLSADVNHQDSNSVWSASGTSISGAATTQSAGGGGCFGGCDSGTIPSVPTLTLTNTGEKAAKLSFNYTVTLNDGVVKIDGINVTTNGSFEKTLVKGSSVKITLVSGSNTTRVNLTGIALTPVETPPTPIDPDDPVIDDEDVALSENGMTASKDLGGMHMDKTLIQNADGTFSVKLQAYATGVYTSTTSTDPVPTDIVMVLDQSGSMSSNLGRKTRLQAMKDAANLFIDNVKNDKDVYGNAIHRVAVVGFSDGAEDYDNTEIFDGATEYNYSLVTSEAAGYIDASALTLKWTNAEGVQLLHASVDKLTDDSATCSDLGMKLAYRVLNDRTANEKATRNSVIIFLTDGEPGGYSNNNTKNLAVANDAIKTAYDLKHDFNAKIFSVGILNSDSGKVAGTQKTIKDYMERVSSDYPNAQNLTGDAGTRVDSVEYYSRTDGTSSTLDLDEIFKSIQQSISEATTPVKLDTAAVMKDVIDTDNFDVIFPEGSDKPSVTVQTMKGTQTSADGTAATISWETAQNDSGPVVSYDSDKDTVSVKNFDYAANYIGYGKTAGNGLAANQGKMLIVTINGLVPIRTDDETTPNNELPSNVSAGIFASDTAEKPTIQVNRPWTTIASDAVIIDYNYPVKLTDSLGAKDYMKINGGEGAKSGTYKIDGNKLTYQLSTAKLNPVTGERSDSTQLTNKYDVTIKSYEGADKALFFETGKAWKEVTTVPANTVYYDDDILTSEMDAEDLVGTGYNENMASSSADDFAGKMVYYTFKGTGIDVYSTTTSTSKLVTAEILDASGKVVTNSKGEKCSMAMRNYSVTERLNVPSVFFRDLPYGEYTLTVYASATANYKIDGIRVYNPAGTDEEANDLYAEINEQNATFENFRKMLIASGTDLINQEGARLNGVGFYLDNGTQKATLSDYTVNGPKNEIYLAKNTGIAFKITNWTDLQTNCGPNIKLMVGLSVPDGKGSSDVKLSAMVENEATVTKETVSSPVDMYYEVKPNADGIVVILNSGDNMVSLTNLKISGGTEPITASFAPADAAEVQAVAEEAPARTMDLVVDQSTMNFASQFTALRSTEEAAAEHEAQSFAKMIRQLISDFIMQLFNSIAKLFGK